MTHSFFTSGLSIGLALVPTAGAFAQGDDCGTATMVSSTGTFAFDTTLLTTSAFNGGGVCPQGASAIHQDGFFQWQVQTTGTYVIDTENSGFDTQLALHSGTSCAAFCIGYDDDNGSGLLSRLVRSFTAGDQVLIQVGGFGGGFGTGILNIQPYVQDPACVGLPDDALEENDTCMGAVPLVAGSYLGLHTDAGDADFYQLTIPSGDLVEFELSVVSGTVEVILYDAACTPIAFEFGSFAYSNLAAAPLQVVVEVFAGGQIEGPGCADYDLLVAYLPDPCFAAIDDMLEDNDTCMTAVALPLGTTAGLYVSDSDTDFYSVTIPAGGVLSLQHGVTFGGSLEFGLFDSACTLLANEPGDFIRTNLSPAPVDLIVEVRNTSAIHTCAVYDLDVSVTLDPCSAPGLDDGFEDNDDCASATTITDGTYPGLFVSKADKDHYAFRVNAGATVTMDILHDVAAGDIDAFLRLASSSQCGLGNGSEELADGFTGTNNENLVWTNIGGMALDVILEVSVWPSSNGDCNQYDFVLAGSAGGTGMAFCDPANNNSTGLPTRLMGDLSAPSGSGLHLEADQGPTGQFGYYLIGTAATEPGIMLPNSAGRLCLQLGEGNSIGRYNVTGTQFNSLGSFDGSGAHQNLVGTSSVGSGFDIPTTVPILGSPTILPGSTWHFQLWHRENGGASNFSNGLSFTF